MPNKSIYYSYIGCSSRPRLQWWIQGGGGAPLFFAKYFKKSPKLAKIYQKNLGGKPPKLRASPPFFRSWIRHWAKPIYCKHKSRIWESEHTKIIKCRTPTVHDIWRGCTPTPFCAKFFKKSPKL